VSLNRRSNRGYVPGVTRIKEYDPKGGWRASLVLNKPRTTLPAGWTEHIMRGAGLTDNPYDQDPAGWTRNRLGEFVWSKQEEICRSVVDHRFTAVQSCHGTGKSHIMSRIVAWWLNTKEDPYVITTAPTWRQIQAILWRYIRAVHRKSKSYPQPLPGRITLDANWYFGDDELVAQGLKPADHNETAFQGIHAGHVLIVVDEACGVPKNIFDAAETLVTNDDCRVVAIGTPDDPSSHFATLCAPGSGYNNIRISAFDTPAYTGEPVPDKVAKLLVSKTWVDERKKRWGENSPLYTSKVLGLFPEVSDDTLITPAMVRAAIERDLPGFGPGTYGVDVARYGDDQTVVYRNRGGVVRLEFATHKQSTMKTAGAVAKILNDGPKAAEAVVDTIGVGAGVFDRLAEQELQVRAFEAGAASTQPTKFVNLRAEQWWRLRQLFEEGLIDLDPEDEELHSQLLSVRYEINSSGRIKVESKEDMRKRGMPSPDRGDAVMMSTYQGAHVVLAPKKASSKSITHDLLERKM